MFSPYFFQMVKSAFDGKYKKGGVFFDLDHYSSPIILHWASELAVGLVLFSSSNCIFEGLLACILSGGILR